MSTTLERPSTVLERLRPSERGTIEPDRFEEEIRDLAEFIESTPTPPEPTEPNPYAGIAETTAVRWEGTAEQPELTAVALRDIPCTCPACSALSLSKDAQRYLDAARNVRRYCNCSGPRSAFLGR